MTIKLIIAILSWNMDVTDTGVVLIILVKIKIG